MLCFYLVWDTFPDFNFYPFIFLLFKYITGTVHHRMIKQQLDIIKKKYINIYRQQY